MLSHCLAVVVGIVIGASAALIIRKPTTAAVPLPCVAGAQSSAAAASSSVEATKPYKMPSPTVAAKPAPSVEERVQEAEGRAEWAEGQLEAVEGKPSPWREDIHAAYRPDAFRAQLQEFVVDKGLGKVADIDCAEYPCIATIELPTLDVAGDAQKLRPAMRELMKRYPDERLNLSVASTEWFGKGISVVAIGPSDDQDVVQRTKHRTDVILDSGGKP